VRLDLLVDDQASKDCLEEAFLKLILGEKWEWLGHHGRSFGLLRALVDGTIRSGQLQCGTPLPSDYSKHVEWRLSGQHPLDVPCPKKKHANRAQFLCQLLSRLRVRLGEE